MNIIINGIEVKVGQKWKLKNGHLVTIKYINTDSLTTMGPIYAITDCGTTISFTKEGYFISNVITSKSDLYCLIKEKPMHNFKVGDKIAFYNALLGRLITIIVKIYDNGYISVKNPFYNNTSSQSKYFLAHYKQCRKIKQKPKKESLKLEFGKVYDSDKKDRIFIYKKINEYSFSGINLRTLKKINYEHDGDSLHSDYPNLIKLSDNQSREIIL